MIRIIIRLKWVPICKYLGVSNTLTPHFWILQQQDITIFYLHIKLLIITLNSYEFQFIFINTSIFILELLYLLQLRFSRQEFLAYLTKMKSSHVIAGYNLQLVTGNVREKPLPNREKKKQKTDKGIQYSHHFGWRCL